MSMHCRFFLILMRLLATDYVYVRADWFLDRAVLNGRKTYLTSSNFFSPFSPSPSFFLPRYFGFRSSLLFQETKPAPVCTCNDELRAASLHERVSV